MSAASSAVILANISARSPTAKLDRVVYTFGGEPAEHPHCYLFLSQACGAVCLHASKSAHYVHEDEP
jgi:hypothetical protein